MGFDSGIFKYGKTLWVCLIPFLGGPFLYFPFCKVALSHLSHRGRPVFYEPARFDEGLVSMVWLLWYAEINFVSLNYSSIFSNISEGMYSLSTAIDLGVHWICKKC